MSFLNKIKAFKSDLARYSGSGGLAGADLVEAQGVWATAVFRYGQWVYEKPRGVPGVPLKLGYRVLNKAIEISTGISVPASVTIGEGFYIGHFGQIIFHSKVQAGKNLSVGQGVTIGARGVGWEGVPRLGDNVYVGVGAKVLGNITIGDNARIGANAVVLHDVPANTTVVGIPARPIHRSRDSEQGE